jgi:hypothetical protein
MVSIGQMLTENLHSLSECSQSISTNAIQNLKSNRLAHLHLRRFFSTPVQTDSDNRGLRYSQTTIRSACLCFKFNETVCRAVLATYSYQMSSCLLLRAPRRNLLRTRASTAMYIIVFYRTIADSVAIWQCRASWALQVQYVARDECHVFRESSFV